MKDEKQESSESVLIQDEVRPGVYRGFREKDGAVVPSLFTEAKDGVPMPPGAELLVPEGRACPHGWRKVRTVYRSGPAQVATPAYRAGYDRIFGGKRAVGQA